MSSANSEVGSLRVYFCNLQSNFCNLKSAICNLQSNFCTLPSDFCNLISTILDALALAADQHAWHMLRGLARFAEGGIRSVPASVVGVVSRRTSFAVIALSASRTVQHDFVWSGQPVLINVELGPFSSRRGWFCDHTRINGDL